MAPSDISCFMQVLFLSNGNGPAMNWILFYSFFNKIAKPRQGTVPKSIDSLLSVQYISINLRPFFNGDLFIPGKHARPGKKDPLFRPVPGTHRREDGSN